MSNQRSRRIKPDLKPYGFCCSPEIDARHRRKTLPKFSSESLKSLHECPALKIQLHEIVKRSNISQKKEGMGSLPSSNLKLSFQSLQGTDGMKLDDASESMIELMTIMMRGQKQAEYEQKMDRWTAIAEKKSKRKKKKSTIKEDCPHWYTDFSPEQLQNLKNLKNALYEDHEQRTLNRTFSCLMAIGVISNIVKIESITLKRLLTKYNADPIKFLYEIYKALTGNYFEEEIFRNQYRNHERIILSAITFLELPRVIIELHHKLPPIMKPKIPPRPNPQKLIRPKKMSSPLIEEFVIAPNWGIYNSELFEWSKKCLNIPKPIVVLPKEYKNINDKLIDVAKNKITPSGKDKDKNIKEKSDVRVHTEKVKEVTKNGFEVNQSKLDCAVAETYKDINEVIKEKYSTSVEVSDKQYTQQFPLPNDWTEPPTPCPYKYRKLLNKYGSLKTDEEFFNKLNLQKRPKIEIKPGRENLSLKLQHFLLDVEADFYNLTTKADKLTSKVDKIAKEIFQPDPICDPCCACREIRMTHFKEKMEKSPHRVIDNVMTDEDDKTHLIGAMALHSPDSSISSSSQPIIIPSKDKLVKNTIITETTTTINGETINQIAGITKVQEHIPQEILCSEVEIKSFKNVPSCECSREKTKEDLEEIIGDKDKHICYGKKFRPEEGVVYSCSKFNGRENIEEIIEDDCDCEESGIYQEDDFAYDVDSENFTIDKSVECSRETVDLSNIEIETENKNVPNQGRCKICKECGRNVSNVSKCIDKSIRKVFQSNKLNKNKKARKVANKCSCDSLFVFLQLDIMKTARSMPKKQHFVTRKKSLPLTNKKCKSIDRSHFLKNLNCKAARCQSKQMNKYSIATDVSKIRDEREISRSSGLLKESLHKENPIDILENEEILNDEIFDESGPYELRTESEEALPAERTIAYLVNPPPPDISTEQTPVREGGRPCHCRENRNDRKTLLYEIGGQGNGENVIEGVTWVTPEPSIKKSDEHILEYELYESSNEEQVCEKVTEGSIGEIKLEIIKEDGKDSGNNKDFFTKKRTSIPSSTRCSKLKRCEEKNSRRSKIMKSVCECKYERKIVKRNEKRQKLLERQNLLKSMKKESFLRVTEVIESKIGEREVENVEICRNVNQSVTVIAAVAMQTPFATPSQSRTQTHRSYVTNQDNKKKEECEKPNKISEDEETELSKVKSTIKIKSKRYNEKNSITKLEKDEQVNFEKNNENDQKVTAKIEKVENSKKEIEHKMSEIRVKSKRRKNSYKRLEEACRYTVEAELEKLSEGDLISLKFPEYNKLPQLSYWISYRINGMCFSDKFKRNLMEKSQQTWISKARRLNKKINAAPLKIMKIDCKKLSYAYVNYWKQKIAKEKVKFYSDVREDIVNIGREMWSTMEFEKFSHILFKKAYFTYLPPKERDAYVYCPFAE